MDYLFYFFKQLLRNIFTLFLNLFYFIRFYIKALFGYFNKNFSNDIEKKDWTLTFNDEFDGPEIDFNTKWNEYFSTHTEHDSNGKNFCFSKDCIEVKDNKAYLYTKINEKYPNDSEFKYKVGNLNSHPWEDKFFDQQYGYFEICCKVPPQGDKFWPAFWLYGETWPPEIDIFEFMDDKDVDTNHSKRISMTTHFGTPGKKGINTTFYATQLARKLGRFLGISVKFDKHFHLYAIRWEYNYIEWYIDNVAVFRNVYNIPNNKMQIVTNAGSSMKNPPKENELPQEFIVDYVRAYQKNEYF